MPDISAPKELPVLLEKILERAVCLLNADRGGLFLSDPGNRVVRCAALYGFSSQAPDLVLQFGAGRGREGG
jgi:hypothetical protein